MQRVITVLLALSSVGLSSCRADTDATRAEPEAAAPVRARQAAHAEVAPPPEPPRWLRIAWDTKLHTAPEQYAPALILAPPAKTEDERSVAAAGRLIEVVGKADEAGEWWALRTAAVAEPRLGADAGAVIEGLAFYELALYVPAGTGEALALDDSDQPDPSGDSGQPTQRVLEPVAVDDAGPGMLMLGTGGTTLTQDGRPRPPGLEREWRVAASAQVYWPNGALAGTVRRPHVFVREGETRSAGGRALRCFGVRIGPRVRSNTQLCFTPESVVETEPPPPDKPVGVMSVLGTLSDEDLGALLGEGDFEGVLDGAAFGAGLDSVGLGADLEDALEREDDSSGASPAAER